MNIGPEATSLARGKNCFQTLCHADRSPDTQMSGHSDKYSLFAFILAGTGAQKNITV